jgi:hypothetical protein
MTIDELAQRFALLAHAGRNARADAIAWRG